MLNKKNNKQNDKSGKQINKSEIHNQIDNRKKLLENWLHTHCTKIKFS